MSRYAKQVLFAAIGKEGQERLGARARDDHRPGRAGLDPREPSGPRRRRLRPAGRPRLRRARQPPAPGPLRRGGRGARTCRRRRPPRRSSRGSTREVRLDPRVCDVNYANAEDLARDVDLVLDGTDNFETRFLLNDAVRQAAAAPGSTAAAWAATGMVMTVLPGRRPLLRLPGGASCRAPGSSPTCDTAGVLNTAVGVVASLEANEALEDPRGPPRRARGRAPDARRLAQHARS